MSKLDKRKKNYQYMIDWNLYRLDQNNKSLEKLDKLLTKLDRNMDGDAAYEKDVVDLDALKLIYETSIRNFEGQVDKYRNLIENMEESK
ncbi:hypothetical protein [Dyadobacter sp. 32]|uniref:hypothetical protein n=1 Tax=Dyadobacter sp. 32 TaxID=538966 RepID=UPI0011EBEAB6